MPNLLSLASSGLLAFQNAMTVSGNNIANVNTDGYSRQTVSFDTRIGTKLGGNYIGNGVDLASVNRINDQFTTLRYRNNISLDGYLSKYYDFSSQLDSLLGGEFTSVANSMQSFTESLQSLVNNPDHLPSRQTFLGQAELMVNRFQSMNTQLSEQFQQVNTNIDGMVDSINSISASIAQLNQQIIASSTVDPQLLDKRDNLLVQLSQMVSTTVTSQDDGAVNVTIGNGQSLVVGTVYSTLSTSPSSADPREQAIYIDSNGSQIPITNSVTGGELGGVIAYRDEVLKPINNSLSRIALAIGDTFNQQHQLGMDLNDELGGLFFNDINTTNAQQSRALANSSNTGNAVLSAQIDDVSQLTTSDYRLSVTAGPTYNLLRLSDNTTTTIGSFPTSIDGFTIDIDSGSLAVGDSFTISLTRNGAANIQLNMTDPTKIAFASPIRTSSDTTNTGNATISAGTVVDTSTTAFTTTPKTLSPPIRVEFLSATSYQLVNDTTSAVIEGPIVYDPNNSNSIFPTPGSYDPGYRVELSGAPDAGDQFHIAYNNGGGGDNRNGLALSDLQNQKVIANNTSTFQGAYGAIVSDVGSKTNQVELNMNASKILRDQSLAALDNIRGVNLDEEAANLLRYQQAYQAATQLVSVANQLFDHLINSLH